MKKLLFMALCGLVLLSTLPAALPVSAANDTIKVTMVGDSITEGIHFPNLDNWSTAKFPNNYPKLVVDKLNAQNDGKTYELKNLGNSGSAVVGNVDIGKGTGDPSSWYQKKGSQIAYTDILTVMLGTNDARSYWDERSGLYVDSYKKIVADFRTQNPNLKLYIITSPYSAKSPYTETLENDIIPLQKQLAEELNGTLIDVYKYTKLQVEHHGERSFIDSMDITKGVRVHPGEAGHKLMADIVYAGLSDTELPDYVQKLELPTTTRSRATTTIRSKATTTTTVAATGDATATATNAVTTAAGKATAKPTTGKATVADADTAVPEDASSAEEAEAIPEEMPSTVTTEETAPMPLWVWFVIGGGVLVLAGIGVACYFLLKKPAVK